MASSSPCKLVSCGDSRHFMFRVDAAAIRRPVGRIVTETCEIGNGYTCEASLFVPSLLGERKVMVILAVTVNSDRAQSLARAHKVFVDMALLDDTKSPVLPPFARSVMSPSAAAGNSPNKLPPPVAGSNLAAGCKLVASRDYLLANCVKDDILAALCWVVFVPSSPRSPDSLLAHRLATMSNGRDLTDVCFDVDGKRFHAHRLILAAQSEVFRAELFGSMAESKMECITISDMSASTFKHMLHYIYCNELPAGAKDADESSTRIFQLQHLLVAADRYGVDTLKDLCEDTLCADITTDTVTSTLELTETRSYPKLRTSCLEFLSNTQNFAEVATTKEYYKLIQSYPSVLSEIRNRFKRPRPSLMLAPSTVTEDQNKRPRLSPKLTPSADTKDENNP
uniref:BTB domain-containing protein n=1 Tax=Oryza meridionalis TaxID=40149 RepID=A0A0E0EQX4_9ORYZ